MDRVKIIDIFKKLKYICKVEMKKNHTILYTNL